MSLRLARRRRLLLIIRLSTDLVEWAVVVNRVDSTSQVLLLQLNPHLQRDEAWSTSLAGTFRREEEVIERNTFAPEVATRTTTEEEEEEAK